LRLIVIKSPRVFPVCHLSGDDPMTKLAIALVFAALPLALGESSAQEFGNPVRGRAYAAQLCSDCHQTEPGAGRSPAFNAPSFASVSKTKGMTAMALGVWLQTSHPTMPNIKLKPETMDDIIAYILSLKRESSASQD
jgi:mono/diheme cytochrome c family protein